MPSTRRQIAQAVQQPLYPNALALGPGPALRVMGVDPGTTYGWAVLDVAEDGDLTWVASGEHKLPDGDHLRSHAYVVHISSVVRSLRPDVIGHELITFAKGAFLPLVNGQKALTEFIAVEMGLGKPERVLPGAAKVRATGNAKAKKPDVIMACSHALSRLIASENEADAIAIAAEAAYMYRNRRRAQ